MNKPLAVVIAVIAVAVVAVLAIGGLGSDNGETDTPDETTDNMGTISVGPFVNNIDMGSLEPVSGSYDISDPDNPTITYRAVAKQGFQFLCWTDSEGNYITDNPSMTFPADRDRDSVAVFIEGGTRSVEILWYVPVFEENGVTFGDEPEMMNISISSFDWCASIEDGSIQRMSTVRSPSPAALLTDDGVIADIVSELDRYTVGLTNLQKAMVVLAFVQDAIDYETDKNLYNQEEFWATPMESLFLGYGDCEDGAILFVSIASAMGIDCGFVTFASDHAGTEGSGHMSIAIALDDGEDITGGNVATFVVDGITYAYGETAVDPATIDNVHPMFGVLGSSYAITDGTWTHVVYSDGVFTAESTLSIGNGDRPTGHVIYGTDFTNPPAINIRVGDGFSYTPGTTLPADFVVSGDGLVVNGGFLAWDSETGTLSGIASDVGTFTVLITVTSTEGPVQTAVQTVTLIVEASDGVGSSDHHLIYGDGVWNVESTAPEDTDTETDDGEPDDTMLYIVLGLVTVALIIIAWRVI